MKTAIYIEDGTVQLVVTPESDFEKNALTMFREKPLEATLFSGSFYNCQGGWVRHAEPISSVYDCNRNRQDQSLILKIAEQRVNPIS